jgi:hypothetical protein
MSRRDKALVVWAAVVAAVMVAWALGPADGVGAALTGAVLGGLLLWLLGAAVIVAVAWVARPPQRR